MTRWVGALILALGLAGCAGAPCVEKCEEIREKLIKNFGYSESEVDCAHPKWDQADTCVACKELLRGDYDVSPSDPNFCDTF